MSRFKTELCNNLIELGNCKYGDRCHYAHGVNELRQVSRRHPKYRTEKCKNFELTGKCPFGPRCSYVHPKPDLDSMIEQLSKYIQHTRAPKPESEDDPESLNIFTATRTSTRTSTSTCDSFATSNDEENKENQRIITYQNSRNTLLNSQSKIVGRHLNHINHNHNHNHHHNIHPFAINDNANLQDRNYSSSSTAPAAPFSTISLTNANVSSQASNTSSSIIRTPLGSSRSNNILTPINVSNNYQANDHHHHHQMNGTSLTNMNNGVCSKNLSIFEASGFESNKKLRLFDTDSSSPNTNNTASNPFAISNPLSDFLNSTNMNSRSPMNPNKQFYTRF